MAAWFRRLRATSLLLAPALIIVASTNGSANSASTNDSRHPGREMFKAFLLWEEPFASTFPDITQEINSLKEQAADAMPQIRTMLPRLRGVSFEKLQNQRRSTVLRI